METLGNFSKGDEGAGDGMAVLPPRGTGSTEDLCVREKCADGKAGKPLYAGDV